MIYSLSATQICSDLKPVFGVIGWVILGIKILVPVVLIVVGMLDLTKAIAGKDDDVIKKAQQGLIKKAIAAVIVFLVPTIVGAVMSLLGTTDYKECAPCINSPWDCRIGSTPTTTP